MLSREVPSQVVVVVLVSLVGCNVKVGGYLGELWACQLGGLWQRKAIRYLDGWDGILRQFQAEFSKQPKRFSSEEKVTAIRQTCNRVTISEELDAHQHNCAYFQHFGHRPIQSGDFEDSAEL